MSINLKVEDYCQECEAFDPVADTTKIYEENGDVFFLETVVICSEARKCRNFVRYLERRLQAEVKDDA